MSDQSLSVLIVDDKEYVRVPLAEWLESAENMSVQTAASGEEALSLVSDADNKFDVIVMDKVLSGLDGIEAMRLIRTDFPDMPVIMFTGEDPDAGIEALKQGAYRYLEKPFENEELASLIKSVMERDVTLNRTATNVCRLLETPVCIIWVLDRASGQFEVAAWIGNVDQDYRQNVHIKWRSAANLQFMKQRGPMCLRDVHNKKLAPHYEHSEEAKAHGWVSLLSAPMLAEGHVIGIVDTYTSSPKHFTEDDKALIEILAGQAATAVRNRQLFDRSQALLEINQRITGTFAINELLGLILQRGLDLVGTDIGWLYLVDQEAQELRIQSSRGIGPEEAKLTRKVGEGITGWVAEHGQSQNVPDVTEDNRYLHARGPEIRSEISVPLKQESQVVGVLTAKSVFPDAFTEDDLYFLSTFASQAAIALENARQHQELETHTAQLTQLQEITAVLSSRPGDFEGILNLITRSVSSIVKGASCAIRLYDSKTGQFSAQLAAVGVLKYIEDRVPRDQGVSRYVVQQKTARYLEGRKDLESPSDGGPAVHGDVLAREEVQAVAYIPLKGEGTIIGLLYVDLIDSDRFSPSDRQALELFAQQAAISIENSRRFGDSRRRIRDLEIIDDVAQTINNKIERIAILQTIVTQIAERLNCTHCTVFFPQGQRDGIRRLVPEETHGIRSKQILTRDFGLDEGLVGWAFKNGEPIILADARQDKRFAPARQAPNRPRSMLLVPIKIGDQTIGVISADQDEFDWFSESDRRLVEALAKQAGTAIERATSLDLLQDISNRIIGQQHINDIMREIVSGAIRLTNTSTGVIYLVSEDGRSVIRSFCPPGFDHPKPRMDKKTGLTRTVITTGQVLKITNFSQDPRANPVLHDLFQSVIGVPLKAAERTIGVLFLNDRDPHDFSETEISMLSRLADQATIAIENATLFEQEQKRADMLDLLQQIGSRITSSLELEQTLEFILRGAMALIHMDSGVVHLLNEAGTSIDRSFEIPENFHPVPRLSTEKSMTRTIIQTRQIISVGDVTEEGRVNPVMAEKGIASLIGVPITHDNEVSAVLYLNSNKPHHFTQEEQSLLLTLANQAAIAIKNARLFEELDERADQLVQLQQISSAITGGPLEIGRVLNLVVSSISYIFSDISCAMRLYEPTTDSFESLKTTGLLEELPDRRPRLVGTTRHTMRTKAPLYIEDACAVPQGDRPTVRQDLLERGVKSMACFPLISDGEIIGILYVTWRTTRQFSRNDKLLLELFADQATAAIQNALRYEQRAKDIAAFQEINATITTASWDEISKLIAQKAKELTQAERSRLWLVDRNLLVPGEKYEQKAKETATLEPLPIDKNSINGWVAVTGEPYRCSHIETDPNAEAWGKDFQSCMVAPLRFGGQLIGTLAVESDATDAFSDRQMELLKTLADQAAIAIENMRRIREQKALSEIGRALAAGAVPFRKE